MTGGVAPPAVPFCMLLVLGSNDKRCLNHHSFMPTMVTTIHIRTPNEATAPRFSFRQEEIKEMIIIIIRNTITFEIVVKEK